MRNFSRVLLVMVGLLLLVGTIVVVFRGTRNPSSGYSIAIALSTAIAAPIGLTSLGAAWRLGGSVRAQDLQTEAKAKMRAARALADAETAETIKREMEAYVTLRARYLEVERRRGQLFETAEALSELHSELNKLESHIDVAATQLSPDTVKVLDEILRERSRPSFSIPLPLINYDVGPILGQLIEAVEDRREQRRVKRLAALVPGAIPDRKSTDQP